MTCLSMSDALHDAGRVTAIFRYSNSLNYSGLFQVVDQAVTAYD